MTIKVYAAGDKVLLDLCGRRRDLVLTPVNAAALADMLDDRAKWAEGAEPELVKGEQWDVHVRSYGGFVAIRFYSPDLGAPERVPMPAAVARKLAETLRANARAAGYKIRFTTDGAALPMRRRRTVRGEIVGR